MSRLTNVKWVKVPTQSEDDRLFGCRLFLNNPVWFPIFGDWFGLRGSCDKFRELFASSFSAEVKGGGLYD